MPSQYVDLPEPGGPTISWANGILYQKRVSIGCKGREGSSYCSGYGPLLQKAQPTPVTTARAGELMKRRQTSSVDLSFVALD